MSNFLWPQKLPKRLPCRNECSWKSKWFPKYWMIGKSGHDTRRWWMSNPGASPNGLDSSSVIPSPGEERDCHTFGTKVENKEVHVCFPNANRFYFSWWKSQFCTTSSVGGKCMYTLFKDLTLEFTLVEWALFYLNEMAQFYTIYGRIHFFNKWKLSTFY